MRPGGSMGQGELGRFEGGVAKGFGVSLAKYLASNPSSATQQMGKL